MSQTNVEALIGKLVTDEGFRRRFADQPTEVLRELVDSGWALTPAEQRALVCCNLGVVERCSRAVDPRLLKVDLRETPESKAGDTERRTGADASAVLEENPS
jgi:hypothetical protein